MHVPVSDEVGRHALELRAREAISDAIEKLADGYDSVSYLFAVDGRRFEVLATNCPGCDGRHIFVNGGPVCWRWDEETGKLVRLR